MSVSLATIEILWYSPDVRPDLTQYYSFSSDHHQCIREGPCTSNPPELPVELSKSRADTRNDVDLLYGVHTTHILRRSEYCVYHRPPSSSSSSQLRESLKRSKNFPPCSFYAWHGTRPPQHVSGTTLKKEPSIYGESRPRSKHEEKRMMAVVLLPSLKSFPAPA
jgi:hypothetical protein